MFRFVWQNTADDIIRDVGEYWTKYGFLPSREVASRIKQLCAVGYLGRKIVAVSTARPVESEQLRCRFFYYRTTVAADSRRHGVATQLCEFSRDKLDDWSRAHPDERMKGLLIVLQAAEFSNLDKAAIATPGDLKLIFSGYNRDGEKMRIQWFRDAIAE